MKTQHLRYAALATIAAANAYRAHLLASRKVALLARPEAKPDLRPCTATVTRLHGEVVHCFLPSPHGGFHTGRADGVGRYTWPDKESDGADKSAGSGCNCDCAVLFADMAQLKQDEWCWRIFDLGCDKQERIFAVGSSEDLAETYDDVATTMRALADSSGMDLGEVQFSVMHHATASVGVPS